MSAHQRLISEPSSAPLQYHIERSSSHSGNYVAQNILIDNPADQSSRWSGATRSGPSKQWLILRLDSPAVLKSITFGKFHKAHQCNMKEFAVLVGTSLDNMTRVLHASLKNDSMSESFTVKHTNNAGLSFPTLFVKIVPLSGHNPHFNTSIWHVSMTGISDEAYVRQVQMAYEEYRETTVLRHVLKHLRQRRFLTPYDSIISRAGLQTEHPLVSQLHKSVVLDGDWETSERLLEQMADASLFHAYLYSCQPHALWDRLQGADLDGDIPSQRAGHAMCFDPDRREIYLHGGWDGSRSLADFWVYDIAEDRWSMISAGLKDGPEPGPRSCHKMIFDRRTGAIYMLGKLSGADTVPPDVSGSASATASAGAAPTSGTSRPYFSEFYRFDTRGEETGTWRCLSPDTATIGGPPLVYDHQMVIDPDSQIIYVFGGRVINGDWNNYSYSGLYSYNIRLAKWTTLQPADSSGTALIPSRFGHSMVLDPDTKTLYIMGGQRDGKYLSDMYAYDIKANCASELYSNFTTSGGPEPCFTQRAAIDPTLKEIYVICGLVRPHNSQGSQTVLSTSSPYYVYHYGSRAGRWTRILPPLARSTSEGDVAAQEPIPRYAHQLVYDASTRTIYMHGGNGSPSTAATNPEQQEADNIHASEGGDVVDDGENNSERDREKEKRLDDFWSMKLVRPASSEVVRRGRFLTRRQQFREMCNTQPAIESLAFLQSKLATVVDHSDREEAEQFRSLLTCILVPPSPDLEPPSEPPHKRLRADEDGGSDADSESSASARAGSSASQTGSSAPQAESSAPRGESPRLSVSAEYMLGQPDAAEKAGKAISARTFEQRNAVFEGLLEFVDQDAKEPAGNLLDLVDLPGLGGRSTDDWD
ncbi:Muskelin N-terminus-domain-containing protein [Schizophyllum amplum]|uniref:Muskelin N-terminus-domain-containing protein n=1 Tax=Schizophyllum amplum TaxID=97359 RepID=A0A550CZ99_9AGAR|nr:Muskelin N-terminus-domain-containing protein [Auriculariopsis ampla]